MFDIKDMFVSIPIKETEHVTKYLVTLINIFATMQGQLSVILIALLAHNYFNFRNEFYQAPKGIAMGSPVSGQMAEIFLHY
jgi:hypothetical protein